MACVSIQKIVSTLTKDPLLLEGWMQLADCLEVPLVGYIGNLNAFRNGTATIHELLVRVVELWVEGTVCNSHGESDLVIHKTVGELSTHLRSLNFVRCADEMVALGLDSSILKGGSQKMPPLDEKWWPEEKRLPYSFVERKIGDVLLVEKVDGLLHHDEKKAAISRQAVISGLGGTGKSTVAKWYANRYSNRYTFIIWLDCGENSLSSSISRLWNRISARNGLKYRPQDISDMAQECFTVLRECDTLLIYDNAEEYGGIKEVLPKTGKWEKLSCLITSRSNSWGDKNWLGEIPQWILGSLSIDESVQLLKSTLEDVDCTEEGLVALSRRLGCLPLALQIAISNLNKHYSAFNGGVYGYNKVLEKTCETLLLSSKTLGDYEKGLLATLSETALKIKKQGELGKRSWKLLCTLAYLDPTVPLQVVASVEQIDLEMAEEISDLLAKYSLVNLTVIERRDIDTCTFDETDYPLVSIHRLLQETLRHVNRDNDKDIYSEIFRWEPTERRHVIHKWGAFIKNTVRSFQNNPVQKMAVWKEYEISKRQIYENLTLKEIAWEEKPADAQVLLNVYREMNSMRCKATYPILWNISSFIPTGLLGRGLWNYYLTDCIISFLQGKVLYFLNQKRSALQNFGDAEEKASKLFSVNGEGRETYLYYEGRTLPSWTWTKKRFLTYIQIYKAQVFSELEEGNKALEEIMDITRSHKGTLELLDGILFIPLQLDEIVANHFLSVNLTREQICIKGAINWVQRFTEHVFEECGVHECRFRGQKGKDADSFDYHDVLPTKCRKLSFSRSYKDGNTTFNMSQVWPQTEILMLERCRIVWDTPRFEYSRMTSMEFKYIVNGFPDNPGIWKHFPNLRSILIEYATVPRPFFPPTMSSITLERVFVNETPGKMFVNPSIVQNLSLTCMKVENAAEIAKMFNIQSTLKLSFCYFGEGVLEKCKSGHVCPLLSILEMSPSTIFENTSEWEHFVYHGFEPQRTRYFRYDFEIKRNAL